MQCAKLHFVVYKAAKMKVIPILMTLIATNALLMNKTVRTIYARAYILDISF